MNETRNTISEINECVRKARVEFNLDETTGLLYEDITSNIDALLEKKIFVFKENLESLSGFIGYVDDYTVICINCMMNLGHQNMSLAHELGHYYLHKGISITDDKSNIVSESESYIENEAFTFATNLLYPMKVAIQDLRTLELRTLIKKRQYQSIAKEIDIIARRQFVSFSFVLHRLLFIQNLGTQYSYIKNQIDKVTGGISNFDKRYYLANSEYEEYQTDKRIYNHLKKIVECATENKNISEMTGESILYRHGLLEE